MIRKVIAHPPVKSLIWVWVMEIRYSLRFLPGGTATENDYPIVQGLVWNEDEGRGEKNIVVKLYRIYSKSGRVKVVGKTKTKADGSYKFIVEGSKSFLRGDFYVRVRKPKGLIFTTVKGKESNINLLTGRTEHFRVKSGKKVSQSANLQSEETLEGPKGRRTKYQKYRDDACRAAFGKGSKWDGHQTRTSDGGYLIRCTTPDGLGTVVLTSFVDLSGIDEMEVDIGHCGCDLCTCCCRETCDCCHKCDKDNQQVHTAVLEAMQTREELPAANRTPICTRTICAVVFENPDQDWCQGSGESGISDADVTFTVATPVTPPGVTPGIVTIYFITLSADLNGQACLSGIPVDDALGSTEVTVDVDDTITLVQNLGTDPTTHPMTCQRSTYWDINGYE